VPDHPRLVQFGEIVVQADLGAVGVQVPPGQVEGLARHRDGRVTDGYDDARANLAGKAARLAASLL
jgi:hypothetical protein